MNIKKTSLYALDKSIQRNWFAEEFSQYITVLIYIMKNVIYYYLWLTHIFGENPKHYISVITIVSFNDISQTIGSVLYYIELSPRVHLYICELECNQYSPALPIT